MDPVVTIMLMELASSFVQSVGTELGKKLVGASNGERRALREILMELGQIKSEIDEVARMIQALPNVIEDIIDRAIIDESIRYLEFLEADIERSSDDGMEYTADEAHRNTIAQNWRNFVDLEKRRSNLICIPYWTEVVRLAFVDDYDQFIIHHLENKEIEIDIIWDGYVSKLNEALSTARKYLTSKYFKGGSKILPSMPYFIFSNATAPKVERMHGGGDHADVDMDDDPKWIRTQNSFINSLRNLAMQIDETKNELCALYPSRAALKEYIPKINGIGNLYIPL